MLLRRYIGRLLYTSGNTEGAVQYFIELLRGSEKLLGSDVTLGEDPNNNVDKVFLEDFRVAFRVRISLAMAVRFYMRKL